MTYLATALLIALSGYCIVHFINISRGHFIHDLALGWFAGGAYYCISSALLVFGAGLPVKAAYSFIIIALPLLVMLAKWKSYLPSVIDSVKQIRSVEYLPGMRLLSFQSVLLGYAVFVFILVFLQGASTPIIADDALSLRSYTPVLVHENILEGRAKIMIFLNGVWPSFLTVPFWHVKGEIAHFYTNYAVLTSLFCFMVVAYLAPITRGDSKRGIYNIFLVMTLPLFVIHGATTYADMRMAIPFALGFLFFTFYVHGFDVKDLKTAVLFFIITCLVKEKGILAGITCLTVTFAAFAFVTLKFKRHSLKVAILLLFALTSACALILYYTSAGAIVRQTVMDFRPLLYKPVLEELLKPSVNALIYGETLNFSKYPLFIKLFGFFRSMFSSGNSGVFFYLLFAAIILNLRKIFTPGFIWSFLLWGIIFSEIFIHMVVIYHSLDMHENTLHRAIMVFAVVSSIYLSYLWTERAEYSAKTG